ncbi:hypothetical protein EI534_21730 [Pseudomonas frederiksbergensis]|nr:hypothetical protein [Pseudomonas frederiksbergensis]
MSNESDDITTVEMEEEHAKREAEKLGVVAEGKGAFRENSTDDDFWNDAKTAEAYLDHRIPELFAWLVYQYKRDGAVIRIRTLQYKMTTRPLNKPWYRGNLDVHFSSASASVIKSPDSMWQEVQPSGYISYVRCGEVPSNDRYIDVSIQCNFDGTDNDGWEKSPVKRHEDI